MEGGPPIFTRDSTSPALLKPAATAVSPKGLSPALARLPNLFGYHCRREVPVPENRHGLLRVRSPLLAESRLISFPPGTEMFHFPGFAPAGLCIQPGVTGTCPAGLPHSEIPGSQLACSSPRLIAACHVLHRLRMPRHPPCALSNLTDRKPLMKNTKARITAAPPVRPHRTSTRKPSARPAFSRSRPHGKTRPETQTTHYFANTPMGTVKEREREFLGPAAGR